MGYGIWGMVYPIARELRGVSRVFVNNRMRRVCIKLGGLKHRHRKEVPQKGSRITHPLQSLVDGVDVKGRRLCLVLVLVPL
jgi:hypothetical protein